MFSGGLFVKHSKIYFVKAQTPEGLMESEGPIQAAKGGVVMTGGEAAITLNHAREDWT